ncbi:MAG: hypothetical protein PHC88_11810 [Terrimicrobiaceae bacterium]|nr:hypothetical protein [Terrimicrobiaceae bacterium]
MLKRNPFPEEHINPGPYRIGKNVEDVNVYRIGHPLAQKVIARCREAELPTKSLIFRYSNSGKRISILDELVGTEGWLVCELLSISAFDSEDHVLLSGLADSGVTLTIEQCRRLFSLAAEEELVCPELPASQSKALKESVEVQKYAVIAELETRNGGFFDAELDKLDRWGEDRRASLKAKLKDLDDELKIIKRQARLAANLPLKLKLERERRNLETNRDEAWKDYEEAARDIEKKKDALIDEVEKKLTQNLSQTKLFSFRWRLV